MDNLLDFLLKPEGAMLFMFLVLPGFIMLRTLESRIAGERAKAGEALVDIIVFPRLMTALGPWCSLPLEYTTLVSCRVGPFLY